jgi:hypothetical protein
MNINLVLATGVAYSSIGALIMFTSHRALYHTATRIVAGYPRDLAALRIQQHDGRSGVTILVCGTVLQIVAACGYSISPLYWRYPAATLLGVLFLYGTKRAARRCCSKPRSRNPQTATRESWPRASGIEAWFMSPRNGNAAGGATSLA